jgi:hypothetical protein
MQDKTVMIMISNHCDQDKTKRSTKVDKSCDECTGANESGFICSREAFDKEKMSKNKRR